MELENDVSICEIGGTRMHWIIVDLDCTLVDTKALVASGGPEPTPGTIEHHQWVKIVTHPETLLNAPPVHSVKNLVKQLECAMINTTTVFITNRREEIKHITEAWLRQHDFVNPLYVRPDGENTRAGEFKSKIIKNLIDEGDTVLVIDDDADGSIERVCRENGWTHLKVTTY